MVSITYTECLFIFSLYSAPDFIMLKIGSSDEFLAKNGATIKTNRWESEVHSFFSSNCKNPKKVLNGCSLENYAFGSEMIRTVHPGIDSRELCFNECENNRNCTYFSWKEDEKICLFMGQTKGQSEGRSKNPVPNYKYFCQKTNSTIFEINNACESQIDGDEGWVAKSTRFLKNTKVIDTSKSMVQCWLKAEYIY